MAGADHLLRSRLYGWVIAVAGFGALRLFTGEIHPALIALLGIQGLSVALTGRIGKQRSRTLWMGALIVLDALLAGTYTVAAGGIQSPFTLLLLKTLLDATLHFGKNARTYQLILGVVGVSLPALFLMHTSVEGAVAAVIALPLFFLISTDLQRLIDSEAIQRRARELVAQEKEELERVTRALQILHDLGKEMNATYSALDIATYTIQAVTAMTRATAVTVMLYNPRRRKLELLCHTGMSEMDQYMAERYGIQGGDPWEALRQNTPVRGTVGPTPRITRAVLAVPLMSHRERLGVIAIHALPPGAVLQPEQENFIQSLSQLTALALRNALTMQRQRHAALTDSMTGLYNHAHFQQLLAEHLECARREGKPLSLMLLDIDDFKPVNDTYGHPAGDRVLRALANLLRDQVRALDQPARYGGEEFAVILPETDRAGALIAAERIRRAVQAMQIPLETGATISVTVSVGISTFEPGSDITPQDLIAGADGALYESKRRGRNRVTWSEPLKAGGSSQDEPPAKPREDGAVLLPADAPAAPAEPRAPDDQSAADEAKPGDPQAEG